MTRYQHAVAVLLGAVACCGASVSLADSDFKVVTIISSATLDAAKEVAPADRVSDQPIKHVESAEGNLGIGVVHRPVIEAGGPIRAIQHHRQSEVYRVMGGSGTLVTSANMSDSSPLSEREMSSSSRRALPMALVRLPKRSPTWSCVSIQRGWLH